MNSEKEVLKDQPSYNIIWVHEWKWIIKNWNRVFMTYLDEKWQPFLFNWEPIIIKKVSEDKTEATIVDNGIINLWICYERIDNERNIILNDWKPVIEVNSALKWFLLLPGNRDNQLILANSKNHHNINNPLEKIRQDIYVYGKNDDFAVWINIFDGMYKLFEKTEEGYKELDLSHLNISNLFREPLRVPSKDSMNAIWWKYIAYDEEKKEFYKVVIWDQLDYNGAKIERGTYIIVLRDGKEKSFSPSIVDPKKPQVLEINGNKLLLTYETETDDEEWHYDESTESWEPKITYNFFAEIEWHEEPIDPENYFEVEWVRFCKFWIDDYNFKNVFTDWKILCQLEIDEQKKIKLISFEWKELPYKIFNSSNQFWLNKFTWVLHIQWETRELLPVVKKTKTEEVDWKEKKKDIYERLILDEEQKKLHIIWVSDENCIVCMAKDISNTSRFRFYKINPDNTLTFVFRDNYKINFNKENGSITLSVLTDNSDLNSWIFYNIVRKPNSSSIFDPIIIDWKEYYLVNIEGWENRYIKINDDKSWFVFANMEEFEVDKDTLLPKQSQSFEFNGKKIYLKDNWILNIWERKFQLCDVNWENRDSPSNSIIQIGSIKVLLLKDVNRINWDIYWYAEWDTEVNSSIDIRFHSIGDTSTKYIQNVHNFVKIINVWWNKVLVLYYDKTQNAISIAEEVSWKIVSRYLNVKGNKNQNWESESDILNIEWEEFKNNWKDVKIVDLLWDSYMQWEDKNVYYKWWEWSNLSKITLPGNIKVWNGLYCKPTNYENLVGLKKQKWKPKKYVLNLSWDNKKELYYVDKEHHIQKVLINWVEKTIYTFFNSEMNRLEQYEKEWDSYKHFWLGGTKNVLLMDDTLRVRSDWEKEPIHINRYDWIIEATNKSGNKIVLFDNDVSKKFTYWVDFWSWTEVFAVKKVWNQYHAVSCQWNQIKVSIDYNWVIKIDGIEYNKEMLNTLYLILTKDIWVKETVAWVEWDIEKIVNWK